MKSFVVSFAIVLGSLIAPAHGLAQAGAQTLNLHSLAPSTNCPVGLTAKRAAGYGGTLAIDGGQQKRVGQKLQVTLTNWKSSAEVAQIRITVHGFAGKGGLVSIATAKADPMEAKRTFDVQLTIGTNKESSANLWLNGFTAISLIDINSITYANGSTWQSSAQETCHFAPEGMMLISSVE